MPLRLLSLLLVVNFSTLFAGSVLALDSASTQLRGPRDSDTAQMLRQLGPLSPTDTLWRIAERVKPDGTDVSTYQVMYAIYLKNPDAFIDGNLNHLRPGSTLSLPGLRDIRSVDINVARAKSEADDRAWSARNKTASRPSNQPSGAVAAQQASPAQLQQLTELKDQFGNSMLMIEAIARENNQLKTTLAQVQTELLALQQQLGEDSLLQQQLNTLLSQQADILATQRAQEQQAAEAAKALAAEQAKGSSAFNNPLMWVMAASIPALLILFGVVLWLKRRGQQTEAAVVAAVSTAEAPPANYKSPLPPLDDNNDLDDSGLFDIDESLLDDAFADSGDFADNNILDDSLPDFGDETLLDDDDLLGEDILLDDDSLLAKNVSASAANGTDLLDPVPELTEAEVDFSKNEFDANNILSDSDLSALLSAEDDDDAIIELDDEQLDLIEAAEDDVALDDAEALTNAAYAQDNDELAADDLLEEIELDILEEPENTVLSQDTEPDFKSVTEPSFEQEPESVQHAEPDLAEDELILVETEDASEQLISEFGEDELTDSQIASLVDDESFDRTELDAFAEALALEGAEPEQAAETLEDDQASALLSAELDELLQQVDTVDTVSAKEETEETDELTDIAEPLVEVDGPDLQSSEDGSVSKPSEAALSVENPSKMLESYPELALDDGDFIDDNLADFSPANDDSVNVDIAAVDTDADQTLEKLDDSQFDSLLTELEAMAHTTAADSEELALDVDSIFSAELDENNAIALSDADFVEIDNLLANSDDVQADDGRFEQLNVDVGLDDFADIIGNDNPQDVDAEDNGFAAKLDLVRAYIEIDDQESAEQIIAEILESDAAEHVKTEAKSLQKPASG